MIQHFRTVNQLSDTKNWSLFFRTTLRHRSGHARILVRMRRRTLTSCSKHLARPRPLCLSLPLPLSRGDVPCREKETSSHAGHVSDGHHQPQRLVVEHARHVAGLPHLGRHSPLHPAQRTSLLHGHGLDTHTRRAQRSKSGGLHPWCALIGIALLCVTCRECTSCFTT